MAFDRSYRIGDVDCSEGGTTVETTVGDSCDCSAYVDCIKGSTAKETGISKRCDSVGDIRIGKGETACKCIVTDGFDAVGHLNGCKLCFAEKCVFPDGNSSRGDNCLSASCIDVEAIVLVQRAVFGMIDFIVGADAYAL